MPPKSKFTSHPKGLSVVIVGISGVTALSCLWATAPSVTDQPPPSPPPPHSCHPVRLSSSPPPPAPAYTPPCSPRIPALLAPSSLPLEYRGLTVLAADELEYETGCLERRLILEGFLGQESVLLSHLSEISGNPPVTTVASAERVSVFAPEPHMLSVHCELVSMGFAVTRERFGARTLQVKIAHPAHFFDTLAILSQLLAGRAEIMLCPARASSSPE